MLCTRCASNNVLLKCIQRPPPSKCGANPCRLTGGCTHVHHTNSLCEQVFVEAHNLCGAVDEAKCFEREGSSPGPTAIADLGGAGPGFWFLCHNGSSNRIAHLPRR